MAPSKWEVGQTVDVQSRTWAGINKPGGCAKITKVHYTEDGSNIEALDVKYVLAGGNEKEIDPAIVSPFATLEPRGRKRRGREFLMERADNLVKKVMQSKSSGNKKPSVAQGKTRLPQGTSTKEPDQSTSPSTPVTPEHPSVSKSKALKGSVPAYVIADRAMEVSPLPLDRAVVEPKKPTVVRRGLFGSSGAGTIKTAAVAPASKSAALIHRAGVSSFDIVQRTPKAYKPPLYDRKIAPKASNQTSQRKAYKPVGTQKPLKDVFDHELRKAREFLDEVCRAPCKDVDIVDTSSKENRLNTSASTEEVESKPAATKNRREEFLSVFHTLRRKFDDEDGAIEESTFRRLIDRQATKAFTAKEVDGHLAYLCDEGKLMKSDDILYIID